MLNKICKWPVLWVLCLFGISQSAMAWWNDEWPYRMMIQMDASITGANVTETNQNMPILIKLHPGNFADFMSLKEDLSDLRIISGDDKTPLKFHVESVDLINQLAYIWVNVPQVTAQMNVDKIWLYYGNQKAVAAADVAGTYDSETVLNFHFMANDPMPKDATAFGLHAGQFTGTLTQVGLMGSGAQFDAQQRLIISDQPTLAVTPEKGYTLTFWEKFKTEQSDAILVEGLGSLGQIRIGVRGLQIYAHYVNAAGTQIETTPVPVLKVDQWQHIALTQNATTLNLYVDGQLVNTASIALSPGSAAWMFGGRADNVQSFQGEMDEMTLATVARNLSWIKTIALNQGPNDLMLVPQAPEQLGGEGHKGVWAVLIGSMDEAGWIVVTLLAVMAIMSWVIMVGKFFYVRRVIKDNRLFMREYNKIKFKNPALLDHGEDGDEEELEASPILQAMFGKHDHYQSSPIYRLYHRGIQEVQQRIPASVKSTGTCLNSESVSAIRAALDAQLVREIQRLNSKMVFLTIAISGGPFLGLLGTVVGVMMTFAAIALTGDVNISAIAPGVASALLATTAGLLVALPALFGYNYVMSCVKEAVVETKIFVDEYITRLAEYYSGIGLVTSTPQPAHAN